MKTNDAFHRLIDGGLSAEQAWRKLAGALTRGDLKLSCNGKAMPLDRVNTQMQFIIRNGDFVVWPAGSGLG